MERGEEGVEEGLEHWYPWGYMAGETYPPRAPVCDRRHIAPFLGCDHRHSE